MLKQKSTQPVDLFQILAKQGQRQFELNNYILLKRESLDPIAILDYIEYLSSIEKLYDWSKVPFTWSDTITNRNVERSTFIFEKANQLFRYGVIIYNTALTLPNDQALIKFRNALWAFETIPMQTLAEASLILFETTNLQEISDLKPDYVNHLICFTKGQAYKSLYQFVTEEYNTTLMSFDHRFQKVAIIAEASKLFKQAFQIHQNQSVDLLFRQCQIVKNIESARLYFRDYKINRNYDNNFIGRAIGYILIASQLASVEKAKEFYELKAQIEKLSHDLDGINKITQQQVVNPSEQDYPALIVKYAVKLKSPRIVSVPVIKPAPQEISQNQQQQAQETVNKYPQLDKPAVGIVAQIGKGPSTINNPLYVSLTDCVKPAVSAINAPPTIQAPSMIATVSSQAKFDNDLFTKTQNVKPEEYVKDPQQKQQNQYQIKIDSKFQPNEPPQQTPSFQTAQFVSGASDDEIQELINKSQMLKTNYIKPLQNEYEIDDEKPLLKPHTQMVESVREVPEEVIGAQPVRSNKAHPSWK